MKSSLLAKYKAYALALAHLKDHESIMKDMPVVANVYQTAQSILDEIKLAENSRGQTVKAATAGKDQVREELARQAIAMASVLVSYAEDKKDAGLREAMTFTPSEFLYATDHELTQRTSNILETVRNLEAELKQYGIPDAQVADYAAQTELFISGKYATRKFISERKQTGLLVEEKINQLTAIFRDQLDGMMQLFKDSHPVFYEQYRIKRTVIQPARRKTRVEGIVTDKATGELLAGVSVLLKDSGASTITEADGSYYLNTPPLPAGMILFQKEGYLLQEVKVQVKRGEPLQLNVALEK